MECARDCCKVDIPVNSPLSYTGLDDSYIILLFSYSIRFIHVCLCSLLPIFVLLLRKNRTQLKKKLFDPSTKKNGCEFHNFYIRPHPELHYWQCDLGITELYYHDYEKPCISTTTPSTQSALVWHIQWSWEGQRWLYRSVIKATFSFHKLIPKNTQMTTLYTNRSLYITFSLI